MIDKEIGQRIRARREEQGITREEMAGKTEITSKFLYEVENGKKGISATNLYKIATALGCSCDYLLFGRNRADSEGEIEQAYSELLKGIDGHKRRIMIKILELLL